MKLCYKLNISYLRDALKQGSYGSWKSGKVLEFYSGIFQDWKVLED